MRTCQECRNDFEELWDYFGIGVCALCSFKLEQQDQKNQKDYL